MTDLLSWIDDYFVGRRPTITNTGTGTLNDVASAESLQDADAIRFTGTAPQINGIVGGVRGRMLVIISASGTTTIANDAEGSLPANRIVTGTGATITVPTGGAVLLKYDDTSSRWRVVGGTGSGGATPGGSVGDIQLKGIGDTLTGLTPTQRGDVIETYDNGSGVAFRSIRRALPTLANASTGFLHDIASTDVNGNPVGCIRFTGSGVTIGGIDDGHDNRSLVILNAHASSDLSLSHETLLDAASNRIVTPDGNLWVVKPGNSVQLNWDPTSSRWRVVGATYDTNQLTAGILGRARGGLGIDTSAAANGDILYYDGGSWQRLARGASPDGYVLTLAAGLPAWAAPASSFDPATLSLTGWWRPNYGGSPWVGSTSAGASGGRTLTEATNAPSIGTAVNGHIPADFDGTNDILNGIALSNYITTGAGTVIVLAFIDSVVASTGLARSDEGVVGQAGVNFIAMGVSSSGLRTSAFDSAHRECGPTACSTGAWHMLMMRWNGSVLEQSVDLGTVASVACTGPSTITANLKIGANASTAFFDGKVLEVITASSYLSDATLANIKSYFNTRYALSL